VRERFDVRRRVAKHFQRLSYRLLPSRISQSIVRPAINPTVSRIAHGAARKLGPTRPM
jgi:hypothetical protein